MTLKVSPIVATFLIAGIIILLFALFKGCHQSKIEVLAREKSQVLADSALTVLANYKTISDSTKKEFQDSLDAKKVEYTNLLIEKNATDYQLDAALNQNKELIAKHKLDKYTDTSAILAPKEYIDDCESCFTKLETTTNLSLRYKNDLNALQNNWDKQNQLYQKRFKQLDQEKLGFYNKINILAKAQKEAVDKLEPHGRLYLSWGVLWSPMPIGASVGLMYQNKYNLIWGAKYYYTTYGAMIETTINFPLSLKFK